MCDHDDQKLWPRQRDSNNCIWDVLPEHHNRAFPEHFQHAAAMVSFLRIDVVSSDVHIARGCRVIVFARLDSEDVHPEADDLIICRDESCLMPPADLRLYNSSGKGTSGMHSVPLVPAPLRTARETKARRVAKPGGVGSYP